MFPAVGMGDVSDSFSVPQFPFPHLATGSSQVEPQGEVVLPCLKWVQLDSNASRQQGQHLLALIPLNPPNPKIPTRHREQDPPAC